MQLIVQNGKCKLMVMDMFGTTAISSAGSNGNGSLFEYDVPSGYYALNTKNIKYLRIKIMAYSAIVKPEDYFNTVTLYR